MSRRKESTTIYLEQYQLASLRALSNQTKVPVAAYIRQGIDWLLGEHGLLPVYELPVEDDTESEPKVEPTPQPRHRPTRGKRGRS